MKTFNQVIGVLTIVVMLWATLSLIQNINTGYLTLYFSGETATINPITINQDDTTVNYSIVFNDLQSNKFYAIFVDPPQNQYSSFTVNSPTDKCVYRTTLTPNRFLCCYRTDLNPTNFSLSFSTTQNANAQPRSDSWSIFFDNTLSSNCSLYANISPSTNAVQLQLPVSVLSSVPVISSVSIICSDGSNCSSVSKGSKFGVRVSLLDQGSGSPLTCSISIPLSSLTISPVSGVVVSNSLQSVDLVSNVGPLPVGAYTVKVQCTDSLNYSSNVIESSSFSVGNAVPVINSVTISPQTIFNDSKALACTAIASDVDNDAVFLAYSWKVGSVEIGKAQKLDCVAEKCLIDSIITCSVTASDGQASSSKSSDGLKISSKVKSVNLGLEKIVLQSQTVSFNPVIDYVGSNALNYDWSFGDGSTSKEQKPNHSFANPGTFTVSLKVSDGSGNIGMGSVSVKVNPAQLSLKILQPIEDNKNSKTTDLSITVELKFGENTEAVKQPVDGATVLAKISNQSIKLVGKGNGLYEAKFKPAWSTPKIVSLEVEAAAKISNTDFKSNAQRTVSFNAVLLDAKIETNPIQPFFEKQKIERMTLQLTYPDGSLVTDLNAENILARFFAEKEFDLKFEKHGNEFVANINYEISKADSKNGTIAVKILKAEDNAGNLFNGGEPKSFSFNVKPPKTELAIIPINPNEKGELLDLSNVEVKIVYAANPTQVFEGNELDLNIGGQLIKLEKSEKNTFTTTFNWQNFLNSKEKPLISIASKEFSGLTQLPTLSVIESPIASILPLMIGFLAIVVIALIGIFLYVKRVGVKSVEEQTLIDFESKINELKIEIKLSIDQLGGSMHTPVKELLKKSGFENELKNAPARGTLETQEAMKQGLFQKPGELATEFNNREDGLQKNLNLLKQMEAQLKELKKSAKRENEAIQLKPAQLRNAGNINQLNKITASDLENNQALNEKILMQKIAEKEIAQNVNAENELNSMNFQKESEEIQTDVGKIVSELKRKPKMPWLVTEEDLKSKGLSEETIKEIKKRM